MSANFPVSLIQRLPIGRTVIFRAYNRLLIHLLPRRMAGTYFGAKMNCHARDFIQCTIRNFGVWEPQVSRTLEGLIRPGDTAVDIGANVGYFTLLFSKRVGPKGRVVAIEAHPQTAAMLAEHIRINRSNNVRLANVAVTAEPGDVTLYEGPETNIGCSTVKADHGLQTGLKVIGLPIMDILADEDLSRISLIKIDIEGAEIAPLNDILDNLDRFSPRLYISAEACVPENPEWHKLFKRFLAAGFSAYDMRSNTSWARMLDQTPKPLLGISALPDKIIDVLFVRNP